jgi:hypothetical protein
LKASGLLSPALSSSEREREEKIPIGSRPYLDKKTAVLVTAVSRFASATVAVC